MNTNDQRLNWYRDLALFWPFFLFSILALFYLPAHDSRALGIKCASIALFSLLLVKERLGFLIGAVGFVALRCAIALVLHGWNWKVSMVLLATGGIFVLGTRYQSRRKASYTFPDDVTFLDVAVSLLSLGIALGLLYLITL